MAEEISEELFAVTTPAILDETNIRGSVHVKAEARDTIHVKATKYTGTGDKENTRLVINNHRLKGSHCHQAKKTISTTFKY